MPVRVNEKVIPDEVFAQELARLEMERRQRPDEAESALPPPLRHARLVREVRDRVIGRELLHQEAVRRYPSLPAEAVDRAFRERYGKVAGKARGGQREIDRQRAAVKRSLRLSRLLDEVAAEVAPPGEEEILNCYLRERQAFTHPESVHASHLVKHVNQPGDEAAAKAEIEQAHAELEAGVPFAEVAARRSDCRDRSGDLGTFARGQMVEAFDEVVFNLEPGRHSHVFKTEFGYHVALVHERFPAVVAPLDEVRDRLRERLLQERQLERIEALIAELKSKSKVVEEPRPDAQSTV